jgi:hypothetical protein
VIAPGTAARVLVATRPVDFRKGADSLAALIKAEHGADPFSGVIYVFRAKRAVRVKLIWWDGTVHFEKAKTEALDRLRGDAPKAVLQAWKRAALALLSLTVAN